DQGATIRRVADWASFSEEQQELLARFARWRLIVRKGAEVGGGTVEVAHEALFREWPRLASWLEPERSRLDALRALEGGAAPWVRNGRDTSFLNHRDKRLAEAKALAASERYRAQLGQFELDYLSACHGAERLGHVQSRRVRIVVGTLVGLIIAGSAAYWQEYA